MSTTRSSNSTNNTLEGVFLPADDTTPLIEIQSSWWSRAIRKVSKVASAALGIVKNVARAAYDPASLVTVIVVSAVAPVYSSINAMISPSGMSTSMIGAALSSMSADVLTIAIFLLVSSEAINLWNNIGFYKDILPRLKKALLEIKKLNGKSAANVFFLLFGVASALSIAYIAFEATKFMTGGWSAAHYIIVGLTFTSMFASRFAGLNEATDEAHRLFEKDGRLLFRLGFFLDLQRYGNERRINLEIKQIIRALLSARRPGDDRKALDPQEYNNYLKALTKELNQLAQSGDIAVIHSRPAKAILIDGSYYLGNLFIIGSTGYYSFAVFATKFDQALRLLWSSTSGTEMPELAKGWRILYSAPGALPSAFFYARSAAFIITTTADLIYLTMNKLADSSVSTFMKVAAFASGLFVELFSGGSVSSNVPVIRSISSLNATDNLFNIAPDTEWSGILALVLILIGTYGTNFVPAVRRLLLNPNPNYIDLRSTAIRAKKMVDELDQETQDQITTLLATPSNIGMYGRRNQQTSINGNQPLLLDSASESSTSQFEAVVTDGGEHRAVTDSEQEDNASVHEQNKRMCVLM